MTHPAQSPEVAALADTLAHVAELSSLEVGLIVVVANHPDRPNAVSAIRSRVEPDEARRLVAEILEGLGG